MGWVFLSGFLVGGFVGLYWGNGRFRGEVNHWLRRGRQYLDGDTRRRKKLHKQWKRRGDI